MWRTKYSKTFSLFEAGQPGKQLTITFVPRAYQTQSPAQYSKQRGPSDLLDGLVPPIHNSSPYTLDRIRTDPYVGIKTI